jgi:lipopolysaccharide/colanic/teichoic acid biosynthesis glycosyltransferase
MNSEPALIAVVAPFPEQEIAGWCHAAGKRIFDLACVVPALAVALPLMLIIAVAVRLTSKGPVLFRQNRVGRNGLEFRFMKFRTMTDGVTGPGVTARGDSRVTVVGRVLRKTKLDELPQLIHVISGEMSVVGPRPELPEFMQELPAGQRSVLWLRPGITGLATLHFRNEEELLARVPPEHLRDYYITAVLPQKVRLDLEYAGKASLFMDVMILFRTVIAIVK